MTPLLGRARREEQSRSSQQESFNDKLPWQELLRMAALAVDWAEQYSVLLAKYAPRVIGCTSMFYQNASSVALLDRVKRLRPDCIAIIGGPNCEGEMAEGVLTLCDKIDFAFSGESETTFPEFLRAVRDSQMPSRGVIAGSPMREMDAIPLPDYSEYYEQLELFLPDSDLQESGVISLPYESSRGCWWGQKHHCTFCGLNGQGMQFRAKSPDRVIADLRQLIKQHPTRLVNMCDNIMPHNYFRTLLPRLTKELPNLRIFYEQKSNLTFEQVLLLKRAGIELIQPGIESLSTAMLQRMKKGVTARQNIALLRYGRAADVGLIWNLIYGFPGDRVIDYEQMLGFLPLLRHLQPPYGIFPVSIDRFSPFFDRPEDFGITDIRPASTYYLMLPESADARKVAYEFDANFHSESLQTPSLIWEMKYEVAHWRKAWLKGKPPVLELEELTHEEFRLVDSRRAADAPEISLLTRSQALLALTGDAERESQDVADTIDRGWVIELDGALVPLVTAEPVLFARLQKDIRSRGLRVLSEQVE